MSNNRQAGIDIAQPTNFAQRVEAASQCCGTMHIQVPLLVDGIDNRVATAYSGFPDRLFVIDEEGRIAYKGGRGPFGFIPQEMEQALLLLLLEQALTRADGPPPPVLPVTAELPDRSRK